MARDNSRESVMAAGAAGSVPVLPSDASLSQRLARYVSGFDFVGIPEEIVHRIRRHILDTVGCAIWGSQGQAARIARGVVEEAGGSGPSSVIASTIKTSPSMAGFANGVMVRQTEFNDTYSSPLGSAHPSEVIPCALAVGEHVEASGKEVLIGIALGYELTARVSDRVSFKGGGWHHTTGGLITSPMVAGKLLGLNEEQLVNALGIGCSYGLTLEVFHEGRLTMMRNAAHPFTAYTGILAAQLARNGFTGPQDVLEGRNGLLQQIGVANSGIWDGLAEPNAFHTWRVMMKRFPCGTTLQTVVTAVLDLVRDEGISPDDVLSVIVRTAPHPWESAKDHPERRHPQTKETADHSLFYTVAACLVDGELTPRQYEESRILADDVQTMIDRIRWEPDPSLDQAPLTYPIKWPAVVEIETTRGARFIRQSNVARGHPDNPMSDAEVREKFNRLAQTVFDRRRVDQIADTILNIENLENIGVLNDLLSNR